MIFAETERLRLRALKKSDLERLADLIGDWDVAKWLVRVPHPYTMADAEWWYERTTAALDKGEPEFFALAGKDDDLIAGGVGLHEPTAPEPKPDELELGYWLGKPFWGRGMMSEAVPEVIRLGFSRPDLNRITVFTDPDNFASQSVLRKAGFRYLGDGPRVEVGCVRGSEIVTRWEMTREDFNSSFRGPVTHSQS